jgi:hypothetical protein
MRERLANTKVADTQVAPPAETDASAVARRP